VVVQRVRRAAVTIELAERRAIDRGIVVLLGVAPDDSSADARYMAEKVAGLRIFNDANGKMNLSIQEVPGSACLVVSQFTLYGDCRRGKRPSFIAAAAPQTAIPLYELFVDLLKSAHGLPTKTGEFGADMLLEIENDGPVTLLIDSKKQF